MSKASYSIGRYRPVLLGRGGAKRQTQCSKGVCDGYLWSFGGFRDILAPRCLAAVAWFVRLLLWGVSRVCWVSGRTGSEEFSHTSHGTDFLMLVI